MVTYRSFCASEHSLRWLSNRGTGLALAAKGNISPSQTIASSPPNPHEGGDEGNVTPSQLNGRARMIKLSPPGAAGSRLRDRRRRWTITVVLSHSVEEEYDSSHPAGDCFDELKPNGGRDEGPAAGVVDAHMETTPVELSPAKVRSVVLTPVKLTPVKLTPVKLTPVKL